MKKLKNFFKKLFCKQNSKTETETETKTVTVLCKLPSLIVHPFDLIENLAIAVVYNTKKPVVVNSDELMQFALYDNQDKFIGTFFCVERDEQYYGNIIGSNEVIACSKTAFRFEETDKIIYPMGGNYTLSAVFKSPEIYPIAFLHGKVTIRTFDEETTMTQALDYAIEYNA